MSCGRPVLSMCPRGGGSRCTSNAICLAACSQTGKRARKSRSRRRLTRTQTDRPTRWAEARLARGFLFETVREFGQAPGLSVWHHHPGGGVAGALRFAEAPDGWLTCWHGYAKTSPALNQREWPRSRIDI